jgi:hypothetical protein
MPCSSGAGGVDLIPSNSDTQHVPSFRRERFEMKSGGTLRQLPTTRAIPPRSLRRKCHDIGYKIIKYVTSYGYDIT